MAKGCKLTIGGSERFLYGYNDGHGLAEDSPELQEDEIWSTVNDDHTVVRDFWISCAKTRRVNRHIGGLSRAFQDGSGFAMWAPRGQESSCVRHVASSAPVNVPEWSEICHVGSAESMNDLDDLDDKENEFVPPHEYLAREYRKLAATSVLEGVGRTLKGWDMSRVRDAVWSQTGFDG